MTSTRFYSSGRLILVKLSTYVSSLLSESTTTLILTAFSRSDFSAPSTTNKGDMFQCCRLLASVGVAPLLAVGFGFLRDLPHAPLQQSSHHVSFQPLQESQQTLEQRVLQRSQASHLLDAQAAHHRLLAQRHGRLLQLQEKLQGGENVSLSMCLTRLHFKGENLLLIYYGNNGWTHIYLEKGHKWSIKSSIVSWLTLLIMD